MARIMGKYGPIGFGGFPDGPLSINDNQLLVGYHRTLTIIPAVVGISDSTSYA